MKSELTRVVRIHYVAVREREGGAMPCKARVPEWGLSTPGARSEYPVCTRLRLCPSLLRHRKRKTLGPRARVAPLPGGARRRQPRPAVITLSR